MNSTLLERLKGFQIPAATPIPTDRYIVARLLGVEFDGILASPDFGFSQPFDAGFGKMMVRTASHLLGGDACGRYGFVEQLEVSMLLDNRGQLTRLWVDASELQSFLVALASSKMSLQLEDEAIFACKLYAFTKPDMALAYFLWRQQEVYAASLDRYCVDVLSRDQSPDLVAKIMEGLGPVEKLEILAQNNMNHESLPAWQRRGTGVHVEPGQDGKITVDTGLPESDAYRSYLQRFL